MSSALSHFFSKDTEKIQKCFDFFNHHILHLVKSLKTEKPDEYNIGHPMYKKKTLQLNAIL